MMPPPFHIRRFYMQHLLGQFALLAMRNVNDPALRMDPRQGHRQRPGEDEIAQSAQVKDQDIAPREHDHQNAESIQPPPRTTSSSYRTTAWPGVMALCGSSKSTRSWSGAG